MTTNATPATALSATTGVRAGLAAAGGVLVVLWLASAYWVLKDARRRIASPWLVGVAALLGLLVPFLGPVIYLLLRPPEYLEDVRERELEIRAIEDRLRLRALECPVCRAPVESAYVVCPICTTRLKQACAGCGGPVEAIWQACPYCATPVPSGGTFGDGVEPLRPRRSAPS